MRKLAICAMLSKLQEKTLSIIRSHVKTHGFAPSIREVADALERTPTAARQHIAALARKGVIRFTPKTPRSIVIL